MKDQPTDSGYISIVSTQPGFAALKSDGSISSWGGFSHDEVPTDSGYVSIVANATKFAALKSDGTISVWGASTENAPIDSGYVSIATNGPAFAALKSDGRISVWGHSDWGGSGAPTDGGYVSISSNWKAFAALNSDGHISVWGDSDSGGVGAPTDGDYVSISSGVSSFVALKKDGSISEWGASDFSGRSGAPTDTGYVSINGVGPDTPTDCVFKLDLDPSNKPPVADALSIETTKNTAVDITLTGSDPENSPISFALVDEPLKGGLSGAIPSLTYTPNVDFAGSDSFSFTSSDGDNKSKAAKVSIAVNEAGTTAVAGDSGGGSLGWWSLIALVLLVQQRYGLFFMVSSGLVKASIPIDRRIK
jgi:hypothetical protein